jgi:hypothetical protein
MRAMVRATLFGGPLDGRTVELTSLQDNVDFGVHHGEYVVADVDAGGPVKQRDGTYRFVWQSL